MKAKEEDGPSDWAAAVATEVKWRVREDESGDKSLGFLIEFRVLAISEVAILIVVSLEKNQKGIEERMGPLHYGALWAHMFGMELITILSPTINSMLF